MHMYFVVSVKLHISEYSWRVQSGESERTQLSQLSLTYTYVYRASLSETFVELLMTHTHTEICT